MAEETPVKFKDLRPGTLVPQAPKKIVCTRWTEDGVELTLDDDSVVAGGFDDAIYVLETKPDDADGAKG